MEKSYEIKKNITELISFCLSKELTRQRNANMDEYKQVCMRKYTHIHEKYPTLFFLIIENPSAFPIYRLDEMLKLKSKIEEDDLDDQKASIALGQKYYDEFVKDTVKELDKQIKK